MTRHFQLCGDPMGATLGFGVPVPLLSVSRSQPGASPKRIAAGFFIEVYAKRMDRKGRGGTGEIYPGWILGWLYGKLRACKRSHFSDRL